MSRAAIVLRTKQPRPVALDPITGINIPANEQAGSNVAIVLGGADILPRVGHTGICRYKPAQQNGYGALMAHSSTGVSFQASTYEFLTCYHPCDGQLEGDGSGQRLEAGATGAGGSVHYWEIAGLGAFDYIASPGGSPLLAVMDSWLVAVRQCAQIVGGADDGLYEHLFYPDYLNNPSYVIRQLKPSIATPTNGAFYWGAHDWTQLGDANSESPCGPIRGLQAYASKLTPSALAIEAANHRINAAQTSEGQASLHYINQNPTPTDISDKKVGGTPHNPVFRHATAHGTLYSE